MVKAAIDNDTALITLLEPDGYYRYMGVTKPATATSAIDDEPKTKAGSKSLANTTTIDEDAIKKNYRKLSLRHHPDKGGDADIFRVVNRAYRVLMNPKLREQYDILGIDLDDDDDVDRHDTSNNSEDADGKESSSSQGIIQEIASTLLAGVIQLGVRTCTCYDNQSVLGPQVFRLFC